MKRQPDSQALRDAFAHANASAALEGYKPSPAALRQQQRVIDGELTIEEAIGELVDEAKELSQRAL